MFCRLKQEISSWRAFHTNMVQRDLKPQWVWAFPTLCFQMLYFFFFETMLDFSGRNLSSGQKQRGTNQRFLLTRRIHTLSHPTLPKTIEAHIWSDIIRKTVLTTKWYSDVIYITLLLAHMTAAFNCEIRDYHGEAGEIQNWIITLQSCEKKAGTVQKAAHLCHGIYMFWG